MNKLITYFKSWHGVVFFVLLSGVIATSAILRETKTETAVNLASNIGDSMVTPSPKVTNLIVSPKLLVTKTPDANVTIISPVVSPSNSPIPKTSLVPAIVPVSNLPPSPTLSSSPTPTTLPTPTTPISTPTSTSTLTPTPPTPTPEPSITPTSSESPTPSPSGPAVVVNEIAWMGTATSSNDEWIELYNTTSNTVDLTGWTLKSKDGTPNILFSGTITPFGFYLLERTRDTVISDILADQIYTGALGNSGESLELRDGSSNLEDSVDFASGWPAGDNTTKSSIERINPSKSGDDSSNWSTNNSLTKNGLDAGKNPINGTPKMQNSVYGHN